MDNIRMRLFDAISLSAHINLRHCCTFQKFVIHWNISTISTAIVPRRGYLQKYFHARVRYSLMVVFFTRFTSRIRKSFKNLGPKNQSEKLTRASTGASCEGDRVHVFIPRRWLGGCEIAVPVEPRLLTSVYPECCDSRLTKIILSPTHLIQNKSRTRETMKIKY